jgi:hypothetical protein
MYEIEKYVDSLWKLSEFYIAETVDSLFHLYRRDNHHDRIYDNVLATGTADVNDDSMALY